MENIEHFHDILIVWLCHGVVTGAVWFPALVYVHWTNTEYWKTQCNFSLSISLFFAYRYHCLLSFTGNTDSPPLYLFSLRHCHFIAVGCLVWSSVWVTDFGISRSLCLFTVLQFPATIQKHVGRQIGYGKLLVCAWCLEIKQLLKMNVQFDNCFEKKPKTQYSIFIYVPYTTFCWQFYTEYIWK